MSTTFAVSLVLRQQDKLTLVLGLGALALLAVIWTYRKFPQRGGWKWGAMALKLLGITLLLFCVLEPLLSRKQPKKGANIFAVVADNSESLQVKDWESTETRGDSMREDLLEAEDKGWIKALKDDFKVHRFTFGDRLQRLNNFEGIRAGDRSSALKSTLEDIQQRYQDRPLAGVFLLTDGNFSDSAEALGQISKKTPLYPINVAAKSPERDTAVRQVIINQSAFEDAPITLSAEIDLYHVKGIKVEVAAFDAEGKKVASEFVTAETDSDRKGVSLQLKPDKKTRVARYTLKVAQGSVKDANPGGDAAEAHEATLKNNLQYVAVTMPKGPYPVFYIAGRPNWEYKFLRRALSEDSDIQLASLIRIAKREARFQYKGREGETSNPLFRGFGNKEAADYDQPVLLASKPDEKFDLQAEFPKTDEQLFQFSAIIIDDVEAEFFTYEQQERLQAFVSRRGGGFIMLGGREGFRKGNYDKTPIGDMLPTYLDQRAQKPGAGEQPMKLTREGVLQPWARLRKDLGSEEQRMSELPGFLSVNAVGAIKPGASLVAYFEGRDGNAVPALVTQSFGKGKTVALTIGDVWRWGFRNPDKPEQKEDMNKFWRQLTRWIVNDVPRRLALQAKVDNGRFPPSVDLVVRVNDAKYQPENNANLTLEITDAQGKTTPVSATLSANEPGLYTASYTAMSEGFYEAKAVVRDASKKILDEAIAGWGVNPSLTEFQSLAGNQAVLDKLASATGGNSVKQEDLAKFVGELSKKPLPVMEAKTSPLWQNPIFLLLALACFVGEWAIKRIKGLP